MATTSFFKKHPKLSLVLFNVILLTVVFIIFEIVLRIFTPGWLKYQMKYLDTGIGFGYGTDANWDITYKDGQFYSFTPNSTFKIYHEEYENTVNINNLGGRNTAPNEKADTSNLIPFTGDSFVMGVGVEDSETIVSVTKNLTNNNFLNLGVGGSCIPFQRKIIAARYDDLGRPKIAVYGFFLGNDFDDIIKEYSKKPDSLTKTPTDTSGKKKGFMWKLNYFISHNWFLKKLYTLQFIKQKIMNFKEGDSDKAREHMDQIFLITNISDTAYIRQAEYYIDKELEILSKEPYQSIVILIPDRHQINNSIRKSRSEYYNLNEKYIQPFLPNAILIKALKKYNIRYIDPTDCLAGYKGGDPLYYTKDNHFRKVGQQLISDCIADTLQKMITELKLK